MGCATRKILVVDDELAFLYPIKKMMKKSDLDIDVADTAVEARKLLERIRYDALVVDVRLGGTLDGDGLALLQHAKERSRSTKVLVMTGYGDPTTMKHAYACGADYYFEKPVAFSTLKQALQELGVM